MTAFPHVFTPLPLRHRTLANRITFGAHPTGLAEAGRPGDALVAWYRERALGGAGMIVVEPVPVHRSAGLGPAAFAPDDDAAIGSFRQLTDACHQAGDVTVIQQLAHRGRWGHQGTDSFPRWSASGHPGPDGEGTHAMGELDLDDVIQGFVNAARRAQRAGFDGVEVNAAHQGLLAEFWTPGTNRRTDRWGGSFDNRMRLSRSVLERIGAVCGDDFIVGLAVSAAPATAPTPHSAPDQTGADPWTAPVLDQGQLVDVVRWHDERRLIDYVTAGTGDPTDPAQIAPTSLFGERPGQALAAALRQAVDHALVQCAGHIRTIDNAEAVLAAGHADLVALGRGQIADAHLVRKARQGQEDEVRPCLSCNAGCLAPVPGRRGVDRPVRCVVNPSAGREAAWGGDHPEPAPEPRRVAVIGGGPAGLEAARVAAERGHQVRLWDTAPELGGQWRLAGLQPTRSAIGDQLAWYERELDRLGVTVHTGTPFRPSSSQWEQVIILATGAVPARAGHQRALPGVDRLPGIATGRVADVADVLSGAVTPEGDVLLIDDLHDWRGIGTALALQQLRCRVGLVTAAPVVAGALAPTTADVPARRRFARSGGVDFTHTVITAWDGAAGRATLRHLLTDRIDEVGADWLVVAETPVANDPLSDSLARSCPQAERHVIGDALAPRRAGAAIAEAATLARRL